MNARKKTLLAIVLLILILSAAAVLIGVGKAPRKALLEKMADKVDLQAKSVRYTQVGSSGMKWEITADSALYRKQGDLALFEKIKARVVMKDGRIFTMSGDKGRLNTLSKDLSLEGNVVLVSESGDRFQTERLNYRDNLKRIETDQPVVMETRNIRINGVGMLFNLKEEKVTILSQVRAKSLAR
ncbi:MAG: LPS export ABC transporter periplasmic protein LptC [Syntrophales bacterium]|jgi:LPS export ABC transporter protein LptC|nr:LPS export ABC transporter periplasmic protein LptC [Syntrophales bacterium]